MKRLNAILMGLALAPLLVRAESMSTLFDASKLWEEPVAAKPTPRRKPARRRVAQRALASESVVSTVQTFVYPEGYSFKKADAHAEIDRDPASVAMKGRVIGVRRELALTEAAAKGIDQEFVINAGSRLGLSKGSKLKVYRTLPVVDPYNGNKQLELKVDFAVLEVMHVEDDVAVAQLVSLTDAKKGPYVGLRGVLVGDYVAVN
ncbi:MAG TPA: FlgT C-terminal domain-containing protein [Bdellovibrionota bacterium]|jgi:hypothetical protein|nr:FlgT C-terminal domain-containing protein [Bdellovibrionota bacterium]